MVSQVDAVNVSLAALHLGPEHEALKAACLGMAEVIDAKPWNASMWREYLPALGALLAAGETEADDGEARFLELLRTPVRDETKPGKANARSGDRRGRGDAGSTADAVAATGRERRRRATA